MEIIEDCAEDENHNSHNRTLSLHYEDKIPDLNCHELWTTCTSYFCGVLVIVSWAGNTWQSEYQ
jgi:hypothetical protein